MSPPAPKPVMTSFLQRLQEDVERVTAMAKPWPLPALIAEAVLAIAAALCLKAAFSRRFAADTETSEIRHIGPGPPNKHVPQTRRSSFDPHDSDPALLKKHSTFQSYTTSRVIYPSIRTFYRPHPRADKLPSKPNPLPLLVFVHGLGGSLAQFKAILTSLVDLSPCLGIDLPGCGRSQFAPKTWSAYRPDSLAELLQAAIQRHITPNQGYILVGHSLGCSLSAAVALSSLTRQTPRPPETLGLLGICPAAEPPSGRKATVLKLLLLIPTPAFDLWRRWDRRGGPYSASVIRFVGAEADIDVKKLQEKFNAQSRTAVYRRMAWGLLARGGESRGMAGLGTWAKLKCPMYLIGGAGDVVTNVENLAKIAHAWGRSARSHAPGVSGNQALERIESPTEPVPKGHAKEDFSSSLDKGAKTESETTLLGPIPAIPPESSTTSPTYTLRRSVLKTSILPSPASHGLLYDPATSRTLSGLIQAFLPSHIDTRLSLGWQLQYLSIEGKWDVKNFEKWKNVRPVSEPIAGVFRALKTLREVDGEHCPVRFGEQWRGKVKAVVDISHESPVYDPKGLEDRGIEYHKFPAASKIPPSREETREFTTLVDRLRAKRGPPTLPGSPSFTNTTSREPAEAPHRAKDTPKASPSSTLAELSPEGHPLIGVHCHYGFNRTGFFIASYLIEHEGYGVQQAVDEFARQRPPGIRHPHFLDELFVRYCVGLRRADTL